MANEKRLIDANALKAKMIKTDRYFYIKYDIDDAPTVDAVEVVRCKDCIHWHEPEGVCLKIYSDGAVSPYAWQDRKPEDFCSYGERKANCEIAEIVENCDDCGFCDKN